HELATHAAPDPHRHTDRAAAEATREGAPARSPRAAVALREPEPEPPLDHFSEQRESDDERHDADADRPEGREPAVAEHAEHHQPQAGQPERNEQQAGDAAEDEEQGWYEVAHVAPFSWKQVGAGRHYAPPPPEFRSRYRR